MPADSPLAERKSIRPEDMAGLPIFSSEQGWYGDIQNWAGEYYDQMHLEGSFRLSYNGSMFVKEGLGYLLTFEHIVDVSEGSGLVFRPLEPTQEVRLYLIHNRFQALTPISERFWKQVKNSFRGAENMHIQK